MYYASFVHIASIVEPSATGVFLGWVHLMMWQCLNIYELLGAAGDLFGRKCHW
jgi:hypothetical protein